MLVLSTLTFYYRFVLRHLSQPRILIRIIIGLKGDQLPVHHFLAIRGGQSVGYLRICLSLNHFIGALQSFNLKISLCPFKIPMGEILFFKVPVYSYIIGCYIRCFVQLSVFLSLSRLISISIFHPVKQLMRPAW